MDKDKIKVAVAGAAAAVMTVVTLVMDDYNHFDLVIAEKNEFDQYETVHPSHGKRSRKRQRCADNNDKYATLSKQLGDIALAIKSLGRDNVDYSRLYDKVMKVDGYDEVTLGSVFDYLVENDKKGKAFMVKSAILQKVWIEKFLRQGD
ncbi:hypothetical protein BT93_G1196 [Corymbia citriodora subsp. variegata]|nr:hypothetical protein BT93_G1196 [Corymbia citriodora subsp. variegata]